ncbi:MAG: SagB/ThcOx family dehydrogenase [Proteobacteria bacterium]|nr:SagB/ThcOx family dehydrogenase [Pseudomonadota bacterium]MBU1687689.1 SagB/ThcOx family dehydrogenase [Pseudomonadota bacterium]
MPELKKSAGMTYLRETRLERDFKPMDRPAIRGCEPYKEYPNSRRFTLPRVRHDHGKDLWQSLQDRRSRRRFSAGPMAQDDLALLLWAAQGITARSGSYFMRTAPSAGALYPIETYVGINRVTGLPPGIHHFNPAGFFLEQLTETTPGPFLATAALGQKFLENAAVVMIWTAVFRRNLAKYGNRGMRYILMDAGHICQNLLLAAESLGFAACPVAAFFDHEIDLLLNLDEEEESVIYLAGVGPAPPQEP